MQAINMRELKVHLEKHDSTLKKKMTSRNNRVRKHPRQKGPDGRRARSSKEEKGKLVETHEITMKEMKKQEDVQVTFRRLTRTTVKELPGLFEFIELKSPRRKRKRRVQSGSAMEIKLEVKEEAIKLEQGDVGGNDGVPLPPKREKRKPKYSDTAKTVVKQEDDVEDDNHEEDSVTSEDSFVRMSQSHDLVTEEYHVVDDDSVGVVANNENNLNLINSNQSKHNDTVIKNRLNNGLGSTKKVGKIVTAEDNHFRGLEKLENTEIAMVAKEQDFANNNESHHPVVANEHEEMGKFSRKKKMDCLEINDRQRPRKMKCLEEILCEILDKKIPELETRAFIQNKKEFQALKDETLQRELKNEAKLSQLEALLKTAINNSQEVGKLLQQLATEKERTEQANKTEGFKKQKNTEAKTVIDQAIQTEGMENSRQPEPEQVIDRATQTEGQVKTPQNPLKNDEIKKPKEMDKGSTSENIQNTKDRMQNKNPTQVNQLKLFEKPKKNPNCPEDDKEPKQIDRSKEERDRKENTIITLGDETLPSTQDLFLTVAANSAGTRSRYNSNFNRLGHKTEKPNDVSPKCSLLNRSIVSINLENPPPPPLTPIELQREMMERESKACNIIITGFRYSSNAIHIQLDYFFRKKMNINPHITKVKIFGNLLLVTVASPSVKEEIMKKRGILKRSTVCLKSDYTGRERKVQEWLEGEAQRRSRNERPIRVSYQKIKIDGVWWYWNDLEGRLSRRYFRPELIAM